MKQKDFSQFVLSCIIIFVVFLFAAALQTLETQNY